jgi:glycyl-tRNA synthetase alpha subunit
LDDYALIKVKVQYSIFLLSFYIVFKGLIVQININDVVFILFFGMVDCPRKRGSGAKIQAPDVSDGSGGFLMEYLKKQTTEKITAAIVQSSNRQRPGHHGAMSNGVRVEYLLSVIVIPDGGPVRDAFVARFETCGESHAEM